MSLPALDSRTAGTGRKPGPVRQKLIEVLLHQRATGDYVALAGQAGIQEAWRVQQTVRDMAREGLVQRCAVAPSGARPRHVYRAADHESGHQFMARTLLQAWR
jgi:predicted transcriptional regulator